MDDASWDAIIGANRSLFHLPPDLSVVPLIKIISKIHFNIDEKYIKISYQNGLKLQAALASSVIW